MKRYALILMILCQVISLSGCAVYMAANQPDKKDLSVLEVGTPRKAVIAELGRPIETWTDETDARHDIYRFRQGYSKGAKTTRAVVHGVADVLTLGVWEVVGTPTETIFDGEIISVEIIYTPRMVIESTQILK
ncbi:MAG: hypothetical protein MI749_12050 [Desulfovibrionales bacterium]|nr:hypothetical protein [Desulfovibrionales bacterium]